MVFLRGSGMLAVLPVFSTPMVPARMRIALAVLAAFLIAPTLPAIELGDRGLLQVSAWMLGELGIGLLLGFLARILFFALDVAGGIIGAEIGLNLPPGLNPLTNSQATVPATLLSYLAAVIWLGLDLHHWMLVGFQRSYQVLPPGGVGLHEPVLREFLSWIGRLFVLGLQIAAPVMAVSFLLSLVFSILGRAVSQMNVFTESFAVRSLAGLLVLGIAMPLMAQHIVNHLGQLPEDILRLVYLLRR